MAEIEIVRTAALYLPSITEPIIILAEPSEHSSREISLSEIDDKVTNLICPFSSRCLDVSLHVKGWKNRYLCILCPIFCSLEIQNIDYLFLLEEAVLKVYSNYMMCKQAIKNGFVEIRKDIRVCKIEDSPGSVTKIMLLDENGNPVKIFGISEIIAYAEFEKISQALEEYTAKISRAKEASVKKNTKVKKPRKPKEKTNTAAPGLKPDPIIIAAAGKDIEGFSPEERTCPKKSGYFLSNPGFDEDIRLGDGLTEAEAIKKSKGLAGFITGHSSLYYINEGKKSIVVNIL